MGLLMKLSRIAPPSPPRLRQHAICREKNPARALMGHFGNVYLCKQEVKYFDNAFSQNRNGRMPMNV